MPSNTTCYAANATFIPYEVPRSQRSAANADAQLAATILTVSLTVASLRCLKVVNECF